MSFLRTRTSNNSVLFLLAIVLFFFGCSHQERRIISFIKANEITNEDFVYSEESYVVIGKIPYSKRYQASYNSTGEIQTFILYKPEGQILYTRNELLGDLKILDYYGLPSTQEWVYSAKGELWIEGKKIDVQLTENNFLKREAKGTVIFYQLEKK